MYTFTEGLEREDTAIVVSADELQTLKVLLRFTLTSYETPDHFRDRIGFWLSVLNEETGGEAA